MARSYSSIKPLYTSQKAKENWSGKKKAYKDIIVEDYDFSLEDGYIQSFQSDLQEYVKGAEKDYTEMKYGNSGDLYSQYSQKGLDLQNRARNIRAYLNANRKNMDEGAYTKLIKNLDSFDILFEDISKAFRKKSEAFAAFDTEWDYYGHLMNESGSGTDTTSVNARHNAYTTSKSRLEEIEKELVTLTDDEKVKKAKEEKKKILAYVRQYERKGKKDKDEAFFKNATKDDYVEKSANRDFYNATKEDFDEFDTKAYGGYVLDYNSGEHTYVEADPLFDTEENRKKLVINDPLGFYLKLQDPTRNAEHDGDTVSYSPTNITAGTAYLAVYAKGDKYHWEDLNDDEIGMYYYILGENGVDAALSFLEGMKYELAQRETEEYKTYLQNASAGEVAFANLLSVPINIVGGAASFAQDISTAIIGGEYEPYGMGRDIVNQSQVARGIAAEKMDAATGGKEILGISAGDTYQALMSGLDSYVGAKLFGKATLPMMSAGAASSAVKELYESGASELQILNGAAIAFGAEWLGEKIPLDEFFKTKGSTDSLVKLIFNTAKQGGFEMVGESVTEIANIFGEAINLHSESDWAKILKENDGAFMDAVLQIGKERVWPAAAAGFISGSAMGGVQGIVDYAQNRTSKSASTKLTENEQKVVDKVVADRIAEAEKDGKALTKKEKAAIEAEVKSEMDRGAIPTDTIEEVLGGDTYKAYMDTVDSEEALQKELDELRTMKAGDMTIEQQDRYRELKQQLEEIKVNAKSDQLKRQLGDEVSSLTENSRLAESYNEKARRSQPFTADLSRYSEKERVTVQKAIDSGVLNNTNRTHELVDLIAKVSADKGIAFDFADNAKLKESGFALEGRTVNGLMTEAGVTVNVNSAKAFNSVVGHEITHVLEGTEMYTALQTALFDYAKAKGDYQGRYDTVAELYKDVKGANIEAELTADLVGDYLFTDSEFVKRLSAEHRNVFEKIYDEVKYLCKVVTAGSKEARQLEKVKKAFEDAYKADGVQKNTAEGGVRYDLSDVKLPTWEELINKDPVRVVDISTAKTEGAFSDRRRQILNDIRKIIAKPYLNKDTGAMIFLTKDSYKHAFNNIGTIQLNAAEHLPELIENSILTYAESVTHGNEYANSVYTFFAAARTDRIWPVKLKVKEYNYRGQELPQNIKAYFNNMPQGYAASYDTVVLELEEIEESSPGSAKDMNRNDPFLNPEELSKISVADLLNLVKGDSRKFIPQSSAKDSGKALPLSSVDQAVAGDAYYRFGKNTATRSTTDLAALNDNAYFHRVNAHMGAETPLSTIESKPLPAPSFKEVDRHMPQTDKTAQTVSKDVEQKTIRRFTKEDGPIDNEPRPVYNISHRWLSEEAKAKLYDILAEVTINATGIHWHDRYHSNKAFYLKMQNDPEFKREMDEFFGYDVMAYMKSGKRGYKNPSPDWEWHHPACENGDADTFHYTMELIPKWEHHDPRYQSHLHQGPNRSGDAKRIRKSKNRQKK